ncbi:MAG: pentapeptide repeat-containing protein [Oscillatoriales cyanobacterium SM2_1_8]|nr:pentapeptide repeat-containing protein [Oscillatoriales cyanobacterium SM2_1_8]
MADEEQLKILRQGVPAWKMWRDRHPRTVPNLVGASLRDAYLSGVDFAQADLSGADLSSANLAGANLSGATCTRTQLVGANLREADLRRTDLRGANLGLAKLRGARIDSSTQLDGKWKRVSELSLAAVARDLTGWDLSQADLSYLNFAGSDFTDTNLRQSDLTGIDGSYVRWQKAQIDGSTRLDDKWRLVWTLHQDGGEDRNLQAMDLSFADLTGVHMRGAILQGCRLTFSNLAGANLQGADFRQADLSFVDLRGAQVQGANFCGANLTGACFQDWALDSRSRFEEATCRWFYRVSAASSSPGVRVYRQRVPDRGEFSAEAFASAIAMLRDSVIVL